MRLTWQRYLTIVSDAPALSGNLGRQRSVRFNSVDADGLEETGDELHESSYKLKKDLQQWSSLCLLVNADCRDPRDRRPADFIDGQWMLCVYLRSKEELWDDKMLAGWPRGPQQRCKCGHPCPVLTTTGFSYPSVVPTLTELVEEKQREARKTAIARLSRPCQAVLS